jgi:hypothetical protein
VLYEASFLASASIFLRSREKFVPAIVRWTKPLRLSSESVFRRTRSNSATLSADNGIVATILQR